MAFYDKKKKEDWHKEGGYLTQISLDALPVDKLEEHFFRGGAFWSN